MKNIGLFFGSFNPIHIGHLAIANYIIEYDNIDEIWFIISPHNPLKDKKELASEKHRKKLVEIAINNDDRFRASDIEFNLPKPSYTINTLNQLKIEYPNYNFSIIMGEDNLATLHLWKDYKKIKNNFPIICYPRAEKEEHKQKEYPNIKIIDAPLFNISSSMIRSAIKNKKKINFFMPNGVYNYILDNGLYR